MAILSATVLGFTLMCIGAVSYTHLVRFSDDTHTVLYTNVDRGKIYLQDVYGNARPYDVDEIKQWPWELEQKGGSNDICLLYTSRCV